MVLSPPGGDLQGYAAYDPAGRDLQALVGVVDTHGADAILAAVAHLAPEDLCEVTVATAHQAEGREWAQVKIADDFTPPSDGPPDGLGQGTVRRIDDKEFCLAYVAETRTRRRLDTGGPYWIKEHRPVLSHRGDARDGFLAVGHGAGEKFSLAARAVHRRPPPGRLLGLWTSARRVTRRATRRRRAAIAMTPSFSRRGAPGSRPGSRRSPGAGGVPPGRLRR
ncbi:hypothetical protein ACFY2D_32230 [Streptomyces nigra]|uniref:hypothetical protein n=1 Tax=Streptomyces nigra TaxID=1827580 RepID=UPI0036939E71